MILSLPALRLRALARFLPAFAFLLLLGAAARFADGQNAPDSSAPLAHDPAAMALRDKLVKTYHDLHSYQEKVTQRQWKRSPEDAAVIEIEMRFRRPNHLYLNVDYPQIARPGRWHLTWACDGKTLTFYNSARNQYQRLKAPEKLDRLVLASALRGPEFDLLLRGSDPFAALEKAGIVRYIAGFEQTQETRNTLLLDMQQGGAKRLLLYRLDPKDNLLRGFRLQIQPEPGASSPFQDEEVAATVEAEYTQVEANPRLTDQDFAFTPPADAKEKSVPIEK